MSRYREQAERWMQEDPDPHTREQLAAMLDDERALADCFGEMLSFGTAGLRGALGPGPNRMNRALVRRVAASIGSLLQSGRVVVGYDARVNSRVFAEDTASVLGAHGIQVHLFDEVCPTPLLAWAIRALNADVGIMVTASHNPPGDNGYKVYARDGAQVVPPMDQSIARGMARIESLDEVLFEPLDALQAAGRVQGVSDDVIDGYFEAVQTLRVHEAKDLVIAYTPLHGVGGSAVQRALSEAGYEQVHLVPSQAEPDGRFPTVEFPNPEEPGAMDRVMALAGRVRADVVFANDPDADRICVALPTRRGPRVLTGNEVGCLLAEDVLRHDGLEKPVVATTLVSSSMLSRIAESHGAAFAETLTGFKWLAHAGFAHEAKGGQFALGFEEALGVSVGSVVRDKDGISAIVRFADLVSACKREGRSVLDLLVELYQRHGVHRSGQRAIKLPGAEGRARIEAAMQTLRRTPPQELVGTPVVRTRDLLARTVKTRDGQRSETLPASNVLSWELEDGSRVLARPSGTEPKIKLYAEAVVRWTGSLERDEARADRRVEQLLHEISWLGGLG